MTRQQGFSLLEILVAFSVMALSLGVLLKIFSYGVQTAALAETYTTSVQIAESLVARTGIESQIQPGQTSGIIDDDYYWLVSVAPFSWEGDEGGEQDYALYKVQVRVFRQGEENRAIELNTLKLIKVGL